MPARCAIELTSFNPRPAGWPGDARMHRPQLRQVSIRARLVGRAMLRRRGRLAALKFQSAPGWLAGRCAAIASNTPTRMFQSAPGWLAGRCRRCPVTAWQHGFNPRPAGWPGDAVNAASQRPDRFQSAPGWLAGRCATMSVSGGRVSIRARLVGRAMRRAMSSTPT